MSAPAGTRKLARPRPARSSSKSLPKAPLGGTAYDRILRAVVQGDYEPGDRILEDEIAGQFSISRTPVREALRRLEDEGILVHEPHRGMTVAKLDFQMVQELYSVRDLLEGAAAARAARYATDADMALLEDLVEREPLAAKSSATMAAHNAQFHQAIYAAAHNRVLIAWAAGRRHGGASKDLRGHQGARSRQGGIRGARTSAFGAKNAPADFRGDEEMTAAGLGCGLIRV